MELNNIKPGAGSKHAKRRVGRGIGSGLGKRRCKGIWPPSKPTLWKPPARDF